MLLSQSNIGGGVLGGDKIPTGDSLLGGGGGGGGDVGLLFLKGFIGAMLGSKMALFLANVDT